MTKHQKLALSLIKNGKIKSWKEYGQEFELSGEAARKVWQRVRWDKDFEREIQKLLENEIGKVLLQPAVLNMFDPNKKDAELVSMSADKDKKEVTYKVKDEIKTLEDLIRICEIDTEVWNIDKYVQNFWAGNYQVKAFLSKRQVDTDLNKQKELIFEELTKLLNPTNCDQDCAINLAADPIKEGELDIPYEENFTVDAENETTLYVKRHYRTKILELAVFDLHLGKFSWKGETGEDYDMNIAVNRYKACIHELLGRVNLKEIDRILLPIGNDMIHIDNKFKTTTAGTPQDADSRFTKILQVAKNLMIDTINQLAKIAPVDVVVVPGNHDQVTMFTLGEILSAYYHNNKDVNIDNSAKLRKYYMYGQNLIMFTHGSEEKHAELGLIAATEEPNMWARTKFREVHLGHLHKSKSVKYTNVDEYQGFKIRILNSLSGTDAWHYSKGYMSLKGAEAFIWDREKGLVTNHFYNL